MTLAEPEAGQASPRTLRKDGPPRALGYAARRLVRSSQLGLLISFAVVFTYLSISQPIFATWGNITNIVSTNSVILILALGATFVILIGQIDLSATATAAFSGMICASMLKAVGSGSASIITCVLAGAFVGLINGILISYIRISFLVVTLGMMSILSSYALLASNGYTVSVYSKAGFSPIGALVNRHIGPFTILMLVDLFLILFAIAVLRYTRFGRSVYAIGANPEAAHLNGINVSLMTLCVYLVAGIAGGIAGLVQVGRLTGASPAVDMTELMTVIAAVLIGGTAFSGGTGGIAGTVLGVAFLALVQNGVTLSEVSAFWQGAINGSILIAAVGLGTLRGHLSGRIPRRRVDRAR